jgi:hypothetical protein
MRSRIFIPLAALLSLSAAQASPVLLAHGSLSATSSDLSGLSTPLENGAPGNLLGGFGSGIGSAGGGTFVAVPDHGPNAICRRPRTNRLRHAPQELKPRRVSFGPGIAPRCSRWVVGARTHFPSGG